MRTRVLLAGTIVAAMSLFVAAAPATGYLCWTPEKVVQHALKKPSQVAFFTGTATAIEPEHGPISEAEFDIESVWSGPSVRKHVVVPYRLVHGGEVTVGHRYHVIVNEDGSSNGCSTFDARDYPALTKELTPRQTFSNRPPHASPEPLPDTIGANARWWVPGLGVALLLGAVPLTVLLTERRRNNNARA